MKKYLPALILWLLTAANLSAQNFKLWGMGESGGVGWGTIFTFNPSTGICDSAYDFADNDSIGGNVYGSLMLANNDLLYGMTYFGGVNHYGVIFSFNPVSSTYANLYSFAEDSISGGSGYNSLIQASNGLLYGMTPWGGENDLGTIFSFNIATNTYSNLYSFGSDTNGSNPSNSLIQATNGLLYGMTTHGGANTYGAIFSYDTATNTYTNLYSFANSDSSGAGPLGTLVQASNGLFGLTETGGADNKGVIFSFNTATNSYLNLNSFADDSSSGATAGGNLIQASNGLLYGLTEEGGVNNKGVIFSYNPLSNTYSNLYSFADDGNSGQPSSNSLIQASDSLLYGVTSYGGAGSGGVIFSFNISTNTYTNLFSLNDTTGDFPNGYLVEVPVLPQGIADVSSAPSFTLYPNPANDFVTIETSGDPQGGTLRLCDVTGRELSSQTVITSTFQVPVSNLSPGIYLAVLETNGLTSTRLLNKE